MAEQNKFGSTPGEREKAFLTLYKKAFPAVAKNISKLGGSLDEAKDIFQDALVIYYEKSVTDGLQLQSNEQAYLLGIAKHLWARKFKDNTRLTELDDKDFIEEQDMHLSNNKLLNFLETAGQKCMDMLKAFYYDNLPVRTIAEQFGFSGEHSATVQKYKCMEKVRETIKEKALVYEDFFE